jgi:ubiquinone/menaquinone biosynthesis C-methylase UbiE
MPDTGVVLPERTMSKKAYTKSARWYDTFIEPLVRTLRMAGLMLFRPRKGMSVLDVGCGTGTHLGIYQKVGCRVYGIDLSPTMLGVARAKLAGHAGLGLGDGSRMPFPDGSFDLVTAMLLFHEMPPSLRSPVIEEAGRVVKKDGRVMVIDYHPGPVRSPEGLLFKSVITSIEFLAGREHFRNYRHFMAGGGLTPLLGKNGLLVEKQKVVGGGTVGLYLLRSDRSNAGVNAHS